MLSGSALAGVPLQPAGGMGEMDCCKAALMKAETALTAGARLCCVVHCSNEGTTPSSCLNFSPQLQLASAEYLVSAKLIPASPVATLHAGSSHGPPPDSNPAYIRHLALLI
jgi:hypothetical protein